MSDELVCAICEKPIGATVYYLADVIDLESLDDDEMVCVMNVTDRPTNQRTFVDAACGDANSQLLRTAGSLK